MAILRTMDDALPPDLVAELRKIAGAYMARERVDHTLQPTALVNEAYLRLADHASGTWESRTHFLAAAATAMRRILVDHARARGRQKRGGDLERVPFEFAAQHLAVEEVGLLELDEALESLALEHARAARVVEWRFFAGLTIPEISEVMGMSHRTIEEDWYLARAWLRRRLAETD